MTNFDKVKKFHKAFNLPHDTSFSDDDLHQLRLDLIEEEFNELKSAVKAKDSVALLDALGDILFTVYGYADTVKLDVDEAFDRVYRSNMSKLDSNGKPIYREDGKVLKGDNYFKPDLTDLVR